MTLILIILIILVVIYFYYQRRKLNLDSSFTGSGSATNVDLTEFNQTNQTLMAFLRTNLNSNSLEELKNKLNDKTLDELLEENEDYETEIDMLTRTKNSLEADLLAQSNAFQARVKEKDRELKKVKEDLTSEQKRLQNAQQSLVSEKQQHKGSLTRITKLTEQITNLEKQRTKSPLPGEFPAEQELVKEHQAQLREIYTLFDLRAKGMKEIDFNQLIALLQGVKKQVEKKK
jgi:chromosome segregation ATPase